MVGQTKFCKALTWLPIMLYDDEHNTKQHVCTLTNTSFKWSQVVFISQNKKGSEERTNSTEVPKQGQKITLIGINIWNKYC